MIGRDAKRCLKLIPLLVSLLIFACTGSQSVRFYRLSPVAETKLPASGAVVDGMLVSLGPVRLPAHVDRPQIVTHRGNRVEIAQFDRWAGPLAENITAVLRSNISSILQPQGITVVSFRSRTAVPLAVPVEIIDLEAVPGRMVSLTAQWTIRRTGGKEEGREVREASFGQPVRGTDYADIVAALDKIMGDLAAHIADSVLQTIGRQNN
jgi:hypothetical protein